MTEKKSKVPILAAVAVGLGIFLWRSKKASAKPPIVLDVDDDDVDKPGKPKPGKPKPDKPEIPAGVIGGDPGYNWQPRSAWQTYAAIAGGLSALGYTVPANYGSPAMAENPQLMVKLKSAVRKFQGDYKYAIKYLTAWPAPSPTGVVDGKSAPVKSLSKDGWIGPNSWKGFKWAYKGGTSYPNTDIWQDWVTAGKSLD